MEMLSKEFFLPQNTDENGGGEIGELKKMFGELSCEAVNKKIYKLTKTFKKVVQKKRKNCDKLPSERSQLIDFLTNMLHVDPTKRMTANELLAHPWLN